MNKKLIISLPIIAISLSSCLGAVKELYPVGAFNKSFMENYYVHHESSLEDAVIQGTYDLSSHLMVKNDLSGLRKEDSEGYTYEGLNSTQFGYAHALNTIDPVFLNGYLSKLYDGRVWCEGYYAKSRVQLDEDGFSTIFMKELIDFNLFALCARGGTDCERSFTQMPTINFTLTLYNYDYNLNQYNAYVFNSGDFQLVTNAGGDTQLISFYFDEILSPSQLANLTRIKGMELTYQLVSSEYEDLTSDMNNQNKAHFALMLYEVLIPDSTWN